MYRTVLTALSLIVLFSAPISAATYTLGGVSNGELPVSGTIELGDFCGGSRRLEINLTGNLREYDLTFGSKNLCRSAPRSSIYASVSGGTQFGAASGNLLPSDFFDVDFNTYSSGRGIDGLFLSFTDLGDPSSPTGFGSLQITVSHIPLPAPIMMLLSAVLGISFLSRIQKWSSGQTFLQKGQALSRPSRALKCA